eukprot:TRINITY_DN6932_c0_g1_i4.p1 TRINITY_DN6932_c0_g1~~TRINITY_DN6932_c0_g1_i4.p1  ORF type:complete len:787 (-),score=151.84 TRINITY_DN6932_c0_g1_i4:1215-3575(-)
MQEELNTDYRNWFRLNLLLDNANGFFRSIFKNRWKFTFNSIWNDTEIDGENLQTVIGRPFNSFQRIQKTQILSGDTTTWDLTTLGMLLTGNKITLQHTPQIEQQNKTIEAITKVRNACAHHPSKEMNNKEFDSHWNVLAEALLILGQSRDTLDKLKDSKLAGGVEFKSSVQQINQQNISKAKELKDLGNKAFSAKNWTNALTLYTTALVLPGIPDQDMAVLYSNRSATHLNIFSDGGKRGPQDNHLKSALSDAKEAKQLWSTWWRAYFRLGKCYEALNKLQKAETAYTTALSLDPTNKETKTARDNCRMILGIQDRKEDLNPRYVNPDYNWEQLAAKSGMRYPKEMINEFKNNVGTRDPVWGDVLKGHQYRDGDGVPRDYETAAKFYGKAAHHGSAEGMYSLGLLYRNGRGVKQDFQMAISLFEQAAQQPPKSKDQWTEFTIGVAEAEHALGLCHEEGLGVKKSTSQAAMWYKRGSSHGSAESASNLAICYMNGTGLPRDFEKAEQYFRLSITRGNTEATIGMCDLMMNQQNPEAALEWHNRAIQNGSLYAKSIDKKLREEIDSMIKEFALSGIPEWEQQHNLSPDGLSYLQRSERRLKHTNSTENTPIDFTKVQKLRQQLSSPIPPENLVRKNKFDTDMLSKYANEGSYTAQKMLQSQVHFAEALRYLFAIITSKDGMDINAKISFVNELSTSYIVEHVVVCFPVELMPKATQIVEEVLSHCSNEKNLTPSLRAAQEKAYICFLVLNMSDLKTSISFASIAIQLYPKNPFFLYCQSFSSCVQPEL